MGSQPVFWPAQRRRLRPSLVSLVLLVAVACSPGSLGGGAPGNRRVTPPPERPQPARTPTAGGRDDAATTRPSRPALSGSELRAVYRAILDTYVDPVDDGQLVQAAEEALRGGLRDQPALPMLALPLSLTPPPTGDAERDWQEFGTAYDAVVKKLPAWAERSHPDWLVLRAMTESLHDGHTSFLTPDELQRGRETSFGGIGVILSRPQDNQPPLIAEVIQNSPAASSGLKRGDRILEVEGQSLTGKPVSEVGQLIRGPGGTEVHLRVRRQGAPQPLDFAIRRAQVQVEQVSARQLATPPVGYLRIRNFTDESDAEKALQLLAVGRQRGLRGWVVDLRGNPGGELPAVLAVAAGLLDQGHPVVGYEVDRLRHQTPLTTEPLGLVSGSPLVVLVDHDTASGAEILAAALRQANAAQVVGAQTAGNVGVARQLPLPDGSVVQITDHRFVSASGAPLDGVGVAPDVPVELSEADLENDQDPQLARALELIAQQLGR